MPARRPSVVHHESPSSISAVQRSVATQTQTDSENTPYRKLTQEIVRLRFLHAYQAVKAHRTQEDLCRERQMSSSLWRTIIAQSGGGPGNGVLVRAPRSGRESRESTEEVGATSSRVRNGPPVGVFVEDVIRLPSLPPWDESRSPSISNLSAP
jgi:hypothetical protein